MRTAEEIFFAVFGKRPYSEMELKIIDAIKRYAEQFKK